MRRTGAVDVAVEAAVVESHVEVEDVAVLERSCVRDACERDGPASALSARRRDETDENERKDAPWQMTSLTDVQTERGNMW